MITGMRFSHAGAFIGPAMFDPGLTFFADNSNYDTPPVAKLSNGKLSLAIFLSTIVVNSSYIFEGPQPTEGKPNIEWKTKSIEGSMFAIDHERTCSFFHMVFGEVGMNAQIINTNITYSSRMRGENERPDGPKSETLDCKSLLSFRV